jgi:outer membrane protein OmpA-like peptidoglycan-associated protein
MKMKLNKILLTASLLFGGLCANAQETVTEYVFLPHWYGQAQFGMQETLGEGGFGKLLSPNAQLAVGYKFNPYIGARLAVNAWQSKGILKMKGQDDPRWKWNYVAPTIDAVVDMTNLIGGYNPNRLVEVNLIAGLGMNIGFGNGEANDINAAYIKSVQSTPYFKDVYGADYKLLGNAWDGTVVRFLGQFGLDVNFNVAENVQVGLEVMANTLSDNYNSKIGSNSDWYFNALVGVKYAFGPKYETRTRVIEEPAPQVIEKIVEKVVEVPVEVVKEEPVKKEVEMLRRDVFFKINTTAIVGSEATKVATVADFLQEHPDAKVTITGYADKGTGSLQLNLRLAARRAEAVANMLKTKYGISASRMTVKSMGDAEDQPYPDPVQNRVAICIAQ